MGVVELVCGFVVFEEFFGFEVEVYFFFGVFWVVVGVDYVVDCIFNVEVVVVFYIFWFGVFWVGGFCYFFDDVYGVFFFNDYNDVWSFGYVVDEWFEEGFIFVFCVVFFGKFFVNLYYFYFDDFEIVFFKMVDDFF